MSRHADVQQFNQLLQHVGYSVGKVYICALLFFDSLDGVDISSYATCTCSPQHVLQCKKCERNGGIIINRHDHMVGMGMVW